MGLEILTRWIWFAAAGSLCLFSVASAADETYRSIIKPPFRYVFAGRDETLVTDLDRNLRRTVPTMETALGAKLDGTVTVQLTLTEDEFNRLTGGRVPGWAGGVAYPERNTVVIKAPLWFGHGVSVEALTAHEIAHLLLRRAVGLDAELPRWLDEGLASVLAGETRQHSLSLLTRAAGADRLMGLPRVDWVLGFSRPDAELAYAEARSATQRFVDQFGWEGVRRLLQTLKSGADFAEVFQQVTGYEYEYWQVDWLEYARAKYRGWVWLQVDDLVWIGIMLLTGVGAVSVYLRNRKQLRRWREEEGDEDELDEGGPIQPH